MLYYKDIDFQSMKRQKSSKKGDERISREIYTFDIETSSLVVWNGKTISSKKAAKKALRKAKKRLEKKKQKKGIDYTEADLYKEAASILNEYTQMGIMYIWMFSINDAVVYGRTWEEFSDFLNMLSAWDSNTKIVFIHNAGFEMEFLRNVLKIDNVFARKPYHPMKFRSEDYEFRCTYMLTNMKLEKLAENFSLPVSKKSGDLDYDRVRNSKTELTEKELGYCEADCLVLYELIKYFLNTYKYPHKIPLTQTGIVRKEVKKLFYNNTRHYKNLSAISPKTVEEWEREQRVTAGGYTHANALWIDELLYDVYSWDETSAYPFQMVLPKYATGKWREVDWIKRWEQCDTARYCYIFDIEIWNFESKYFNHFISKSKCIECDKAVMDNGRIESADWTHMQVLDPDMDIMMKTLKDKNGGELKYRINKAWASPKGFLPKVYIEYVLKLYNQKTEYKGIPEMDEVYTRAKQMLNSLFGMCCSNYLRAEVLFDYLTGWDIDDPSDSEDGGDKYIVDNLMKYYHYHLDDEGKSEEPKQFLPYIWGAQITANARQRIQDMIIKLDRDVVYVDTDSIKFLNKDNIRYFLEDNILARREGEEALDRLGIDRAKLAPVDIYGVERVLGAWDDESEHESGVCYSEFKTLGAKRYAFKKLKKDDSEKIGLTVAGVSKRVGYHALRGDIDNFRKSLVFDYNTSGKLMIKHNENQPSIEVVDYQGNVELTSQRIGVCLIPTTYSLTVDGLFERYFQQMQDTHIKLKRLYERGIL